MFLIFSNSIRIVLEPTLWCLWKLHLLKILVWKQSWTPDYNTRIMKEKKTIAQEIWTASILYGKTSKEFYRHIKFRKKYNKQNVFIKKAVLKNFAIFTGKQLFWSLFFNKNASLQSCNFIKKETTTQVFSCEYCKIFKNTILKNICERLLLRVFLLFMSVWTFS